jgi:glycerophosphoryl diester phosphodiesterase
MRLAHRGDWRRAPENTLAAFDAALRVPGCDGVEFDVRAASDGEPVVLHDRTLERVQGIAAKASALTAKEITAHGVPALSELLAAVGSRPFLDVELKEWVPRAVDVLERARGREGSLERAVVSSFDPEVHEQLRALRPAWRRWLNTVGLSAEVIDRARDLGCAGIAAEWHSLDKASVGASRAAGVEVAAWTVRRRPTYARLARLGVVAICVEGAALDG